MNAIYEPKGRAKEYCDLALNIYTGCNHGCVYCYAPGFLRKTREQFAVVEPRKGIVDALKKQLATGKYIGREIQLCFTCDPYPAEIDTSTTREVIKAIKESGNHVRILTKGGTRAIRDFDLLDENDWYGVTFTGDWHDRTSTKADPSDKNIDSVVKAHNAGIKTWMSCEPVLRPETIFSVIAGQVGSYVDVFKIGKLNHCELEDIGFPPVNWGRFGGKCERLCHEYNRSYYIKQDLRDCMEAAL